MPKIVNDWPARWAIADPHRIAAGEATPDGRSLTYAELDRAAGALAGWLAREAGVRRGDRVSILAENRIEHAIALFAVARLGAALVPLNHRLAPPEIARVAADAAPRALLGSRGLLAAAPAGLAPLAVDLDDREFADILRGPATGAPREAVVDEADPWLVLYTSGSTGRPKGALITHRQVIWNALHTIVACDLEPADVTLTYTPLFYTGGWNVLSTPLWYRGARVLLVPSFDAPEVLSLLERERVSTFFGVPTTLAALRDAPRFPAADLGALRVVLAGGAACPPDLIRAYAERGIALRQGYGLTEVGPNCIGLPPADALRKAGSIGRPNLHIETRVAGDDGRDVAPGAEGELRLRGPTVFGGYLRNEEATRAALDEDGFFRTGDIVRLDAEGDFWFIGRKGDMFKSGGEKVYAGEVEAAIAAHPAVAEVVVFPVPDERRGEVGRAVVVPRAGEAFDAEALEAEALARWLSGRLARFKVPKSFAIAAALPRTDTGKIARAEVRRRFAPPARAAAEPLPC